MRTLPSFQKLQFLEAVLLMLRRHLQLLQSYAGGAGEMRGQELGTVGRLEVDLVSEHCYFRYSVIFLKLANCSVGLVRTIQFTVESNDTYVFRSGKNSPRV